MDKKQGVRAALEQPPAPPLGGGQPPTTQVWASRGPGCEMIPASGQSLPSNLSLSPSISCAASPTSFPLTGCVA